MVRRARHCHEFLESSGTYLTDDAGYVHGIMHIGLGLEFKQTPILAEGLAEAAVHHDSYYTDYIAACASEAQKALEPA